ncbi:hypothetical protein KVR01_005878 [Diaporthe batatas]|uniref:uncharacterized protein n=1 Tax=Diaporthe batatas TaxID=748121 RepID=UPI001D04340F|nr:uncharacterized protein KVR01_005878 [Diaporthe batatas]KAG8163960.1 hypothetical protein KVR01_005878 [Diaporthe batatas]
MFSRFLTPLAFAACTAVSVLPVVSCGPVSIDLVPRTYADSIDIEALEKCLSDGAEVYVPSDEPFAALTVRWSNLEPPSPNVVVVAAIEEDVSQAVAFAYKNDIPILAYNGHHGTLISLGKMDYGIQIYLGHLDSLEIAGDGSTVTVGGGINSHNLTETLWAAGKQAVTGTCECVSYLGPALGGGHGWLQGHHGLISDQFESLNVVLANGDLKTIDSTSDLWWGMLGAGQNFGIVTSATSKIYDIVSPNWAIETIVFGGDKLEAVYEAASGALVKDGTQTDDVQNYSYWQNDGTLDPDNPVIIMYIMQEGVDAVEPAYTKPFHDLAPLRITPQSGDYRDLAAWTGIALDSPPCQDFGFNNPRFPIYLPSYNATAMRLAYDVYAAAVGGADSPWTNSIFLFEDYASSGVRARGEGSTAFAFREDLLLAAPLIIYNSTGAAEDAEVKALGNRLREIIREGTGREELHAYVNYAYGDEGLKAWFGAEEWRGDRLRALKEKYDPTGVFSFYAPIA